MTGVWEEIELKIRASYPYLYLITHEENRAVANLRLLAKKLSLPLTTWSGFEGFKPPIDAEGPSPVEAVADDERAGLFILRDFHRRLRDERVIRQFKDLREALIKGRKSIIVTAAEVVIPNELEKQFAVIDVPLPDTRELRALFTQMCRRFKVECPERHAELYARSATGLTAEEAMLIFSRMLLEPERVGEGDTAPVIEEKRRLVESEGVLQFYDRDVSLDDVGGLHALKAWLVEREAAFDRRARDFGLPEPKGLLLLGVQGCGKSLTAKAVAAHWKLPLVQFDLGAAFSSRRSPEETIRRALKLLEAMSPVVVWIDEIEKGFAGTRAGGGEVAVHRVFGHFITWLQEKRKPVFIVATANSVEELPPELLRKGRFDELFFVDLPDEHEREEVLAVHLKRRKVFRPDLGLDGLVAATRNFTGAELEQVVVDGLYRAFAQERSLTVEDLEVSAQTLVPIYNTYEEDIKRLRDWSRERTRRASIDTTLTDYFEVEEEP